MNVFTVIDNILASYSVILPVFGTVLNVLALFVCLRRTTRNVSTFVFMAFQCAADTLPLATVAHSTFVSFYYAKPLMSRSLLNCRVLMFFNNWGTYSSVYLLVAASFDRFMTTQVIMWRTVYFNWRRAAVLSALIVAVFFGVNFHLNFTIEDDRSVNSTLPFTCFGTGVMVLWSSVNVYGCIGIPFILLAVFNLLLVANLRMKRMRSPRLKASQAALNASVLAATLTFLLLSAPIIIVTAFFYNTLVSMPNGIVVIYASSLIAFTRFASTFITQSIFNSVFRAELKQLFSFVYCDGE